MTEQKIDPNMPPFLQGEWVDPVGKQEENWRLMTILNIPWNDANKIEDESDRKFLIQKAKEVEGFLKMQQAVAMQQQQQMQEQMMMQQPSQESQSQSSGVPQEGMPVAPNA